MTDEKKISEQAALHDYWSATDKDTHSQNKREFFREIDRTHKDAVSPVTLRRMVMSPVANLSMAWRTFARHQEQRRERTKSQQQVKSVPRTLAQTGAPVTHGRVRTAKRPLPHNSSSVSRHRRQRGFLWSALGVFACAGAALLAAIFVLTSPALRINQVNIEGTHNNILIRRIQQMDIQGQNIFLLDIAGLTQQIDALPQVVSSELSKQWPNQLSIHVVERVPILLWQTSQGLYSIDDQGVVIAPVSDPSVIAVNTIIDITPQKNQKNSRLEQIKQGPSLHPGMRLNGSNIAFAVDVLKLFPQMVGVSPFKLYYDGTMYTGSIHQGGERLGSGGSYIVESPDGWKAYLGGSNDTNSLDNKLIELRAILALAQKQQLNVATIDLRYGVHPIFTLK